MAEKSFKRLFSRAYSLSTEVPSNSRFRAVRELEARIAKSMLPVFILLKDDAQDSSLKMIEKVFEKLSSENGEFFYLYEFGRLLGEGKLPDAEAMSFQQFKHLYDTQISKAFSLSESLSFVKDIVKRFADNVSRISELTIDTVARYLKSNLNTLSNNIVQTGIIRSLAGDDDPEDVFVMKIVYPGACKYCINTYLNDDGSPKVFRLSELVENGWDPYRKTVDYKPVLMTLHLNCRCTTVRVNPEWNKTKLDEVLTEAWDNYTLALQEYEESSL